MPLNKTKRKSVLSINLFYQISYVCVAECMRVSLCVGACLCLTFCVNCIGKESIINNQTRIFGTCYKITHVAIHKCVFLSGWHRLPFIYLFISLFVAVLFEANCSNFHIYKNISLEMYIFIFPSTARLPSACRNKIFSCHIARIYTVSRYWFLFWARRGNPKTRRAFRLSEDSAICKGFRGKVEERLREGYDIIMLQCMYLYCPWPLFLNKPRVAEYALWYIWK